MNKINSLKINSAGMEGYFGAYGIWEVSTEKDVDGNCYPIGIFEGYLVNIAFYLADMSFYSLSFKKLNIPLITQTDSLLSDKNTVHISLNSDSKTWDLNDTARIEQFNNYLLETELEPEEKKIEVNYTVGKSGYFASVRIDRTINDPTIKVREQALSKLTDEEKKALGLV